MPPEPRKAALSLHAFEAQAAKENKCLCVVLGFLDRVFLRVYPIHGVDSHFDGWFCLCCVHNALHRFVPLPPPPSVHEPERSKPL